LCRNQIGNEDYDTENDHGGRGKNRFPATASEVRMDLGNLELAIHFIDNSLVIVIFTGVEVQKRPAERSDSDQGMVNQ